MSNTKVDITLPGTTVTTQEEILKAPIKYEKPKNRARRIFPAQGIRFFDVAIKNGSQLYLADFGTPIFAGGPGDLEIDPPNITVGAFQVLLDAIDDWAFEIPLENFTTSFDKLSAEKAFTKSVFVRYTDDEDGLVQTSIGNYLPDLEKFEEDSLKLSQAEVSTLEIKTIFGAYANYTKLSAPLANIKITAENDPDADPVYFQPTPVMDIFFFPSIQRAFGETKYDNGLHTYFDGVDTHSDLVVYHDFLNAGYQVMDRAWFQAWLDTLSLGTYEQSYAFWESWKTYPGVQMIRGIKDFYEVPPYSYYSTYTYIDKSNFPFPDIYTESGIDESGPYQNNDGFGNQTLAFNLATKLIFMIKQGGNWFYFWRIV